MAEIINVPMNTDPEVEFTFDLKVDYGTGGRLPDYEGEYTITPKISSFTLPTKNKSMTDDLTITQVPYEQVENPSGGDTVIIGFE